MKTVQFIYTGIREYEGKKVVSARLIKNTGPLGLEIQLVCQPSTQYTIGGVYSAQLDEYNDLTVQSFSNAEYVRTGGPGYASDVLMWVGQENDALAKLAEINKRKHIVLWQDIEKALVPLRESYTTLLDRKDIAGCGALEFAILALLKKPIE